MSNPIRRGASPVAEFDLAAFEREIGHPLPAEYRASLLASNGGVPRRKSFRYTLASGKARKALVVAFAPLSDEGWAEFGCRPLPELWEADGRELVDGTVAIGLAETDVNQGTVRLGVVGDRAGAIFFRPEDTARGQLYPVAGGWAEFIDGLKHANKPEPWDEPIEDGDADLLRKWLAQYRRKWDDGASRIDIERKAIEENQAGILDMLVAEWEFEPASIVEEALDAHRVDIAMHFLPAAAEGSGLPAGALNRAGPYFWHAPALVEALLDAGADATDEESDGRTPLHHAARAGAAEAVRLLLEGGADPTLADDEGLTPRDLAEQAEWHDVAAILRAAEAARAPAEEEAVRPFDLCGIGFVRTGPPIALAEILAVEAKLKLAFPPEYRWLLTRANGAILSQGLLPESVLPELYPSYEDEEEFEGEDDESGDGEAEEGPDVRLDLYPLRQSDCPEEEGGDDEEGWDEDGPSLACSAEEMAGWYHDGSEIPRGFLPIGALSGYGLDGSGFLLIGCRGAKRGQLFAFDHGSNPLGVTLPELFAKLAEAGKRPKSPAESLADAVDAGDLDGVRSAVAKGAAKTWMTRDGRIPLRAACEKGFDGAILLIGEAGDRGRAITEALMAGRVAVARRLFDSTPKLKRDVLEEILYYPTVHTDPEFSAAVIARGLKLEKLLNHKHMGSPLATAAASGSVAGLKFLLERGGKIGHVDRERGATLLHEAVRDPKVDSGEMIAFLLEGGVPLNVGDGHGHAALHTAILANNPRAAKALIDAGADMHSRAAQYSPLMDDPRTQKAMARAEKEFEKLARSLEREEPGPDLDEEDAPMLDPDDPAARKAREMMQLGEQLQSRIQEMLPKVAANLGRQLQALGPAAADLGQRWPYPHVQPLIEELIRYSRAKAKG